MAGTGSVQRPVSPQVQGSSLPQESAIPGLARGPALAGRQPVLLSPLSFHMASFNKMTDECRRDRWIRKISDPSQNIGDGGGWRGLFTNARTRLVKALGKEAEKDVKALTVKQRCELCVQLSDAMSGSSLAVSILEEYAKAEDDTPKKWVAKRILASLNVQVVAGQPVSAQAVGRLRSLAALGNKTAFLELAKTLVRAGDTKMMAQLRMAVLTPGHLMREAAEDAVMDLLKENNPFGLRLLEQLLRHERAETLRREFTDQMYALSEESCPGLASLLKSSALQGHEGSFTRLVDRVNKGNTDLAKFLFQLRLSDLNAPCLRQLQCYLAMGEAFRGLNGALAALEGQQFNDPTALGSGAEVARCRSIRDALAPDGRERLLAAVREGNELAGQTLMELHRRAVPWATEDLVTQARGGDPVCSRLAAQLVRDDGDEELQRLVTVPAAE